MKQGWEIVTLGMVLKQAKHQIKLLPEQTYKQITIKMNRKGVTLRGLIQGSQVGSNQYSARPNQFIISKIDARNGAYGIVPNELEGAIVTGDFVLFDPSEHLDISFLNFFANTRFFDFECKKASEGTTNRVRLKIEKFLQIEIPLPPLSEQKRMAGRLAALKGKIDAVRVLRGEQVREVEALTENHIGGIFEELIGYQEYALKDLAVKIGSGSTPSGGRAAYPETGIPFVRSLNVRMRKFQMDGLAFISSETHASMKGTQIKPNDVLLNITGASIGRVCCVPDDLVNGNINQHTCIIRPKPEKLDYEYLMYWLSQPKVQGIINEEQKGATRQGFTKAQIEKFQIPVPPLPEQRRIVSEIKAFQTKMDALNAAQVGQLEALEALFPGVLEKAFRGEW